MKEVFIVYFLFIMYRDVIYVVWDFYGNCFLCIGCFILVFDINDKEKKILEIEGWVVFLEFCSFLFIGVRYYCEVLFGEIVEIFRYNVWIFDIILRFEGNLMVFCIFEYVYFVRLDSMFED